MNRTLTRCASESRSELRRHGCLGREDSRLLKRIERKQADDGREERRVPRQKFDASVEAVNGSVSREPGKRTSLLHVVRIEARMFYCQAARGSGRSGILSRASSLPRLGGGDGWPR